MEKVNYQQDTSVIVIPIRIIQHELQKSINDNLPEVLFEDNNMEDDGLAFRASKRDSVQIHFSNDTIEYEVPINLWLRKSLAVTSVTGQGALSLTFKTYFEVNPNWSLSTQTEVTNYEWLEKPEINIGFASVPITPIINYFLDNSKSQLAQGIDTLIRSQFDLHQTINTAWEQMHQPIYLSEDYNTWLILNPLELSMSEVFADADTISLNACATAQPKIYVGPKPPVSDIIQMPPFEKVTQNSEGFSLEIKTAVDFGEATRITKQNMVGETYTFGKKKVKVEDILIQGKGNNLSVRTTLSGNYNGDIVFVGKPEYNLRKNNIKIEKMEVDFTSRKTLLKTATWLFKGKLKNQLEETLNAYLEEYISELYTELQSSLDNYELSPGVILNGELGDLELSKLYISTDAINFQIGLKGRTNIEVGNLKTN